MGHLAAGTPGFGTYPSPSVGWTFSPSTGPYGLPTPQHSFFTPFSAQTIGSYGTGAPQPVHQIVQWLQILPQQLQQIQVLQQQQLLQLQHLLQFLPGQLQQIQQLIPVLAQYGQYSSLNPGMSSPFGYGLLPQVVPSPTSTHVM